MHNKGQVWDGVVGNLEHNFALLSGEATPTAQDFRAVIDEIVATQQGLVAAGNAIKALQGQIANLQNQLQNQLQNPSDSESAEVVRAATDAQQALVTVADKTFATLTALAERLNAAVSSVKVAEELTRMSAALIANTNGTGDAIKVLADGLKARDDLLADFDGDLELARYWVIQALRCLQIFGSHEKISDTTGGFVPNVQRLQRTIDE